VDLVDEQDDVAALGDLLHHLLEALLELAAVLRARDEGGEVERVDLLALEQLGHVGVRDALGQALDHGGLADAGLADEHGLFFVRRERICMIRSISVSRPTTGSSLPSAASLVRLRPNWSSSFEDFLPSPWPEPDAAPAPEPALPEPDWPPSGDRPDRTACG
jgi:hypothetical protein